MLSLNAITCYITYMLDLWTLDPCASDSVLRHLKGKQSPLIVAVVSCENTVQHVLLQIRRWRKRCVEVLRPLLRLCLSLSATAKKLSFGYKFKYHRAIMYFWERLSPFFTWWLSRATAVLQQKTIRCNQKHSITAGHIVSPPLPRNVLACWTGCCKFDVMLCTLLPLTNFPTD